MPSVFGRVEIAVADQPIADDLSQCVGLGRRRLWLVGNVAVNAFRQIIGEPDPCDRSFASRGAATLFLFNTY